LYQTRRLKGDKTMITITKKLNGLTIRELKELIKDVDENTEISVWSEIPLQKLNIEIVKYDFGEIDVDINVE
jgi:ribosomal protein L7/L12